MPPSTISISYGPDICPCGGGGGGGGYNRAFDWFYQADLFKGSGWLLLVIHSIATYILKLGGKKCTGKKGTGKKGTQNSMDRI